MSSDKGNNMTVRRQAKKAEWRQGSVWISYRLWSLVVEASLAQRTMYGQNSVVLRQSHLGKAKRSDPSEGWFEMVINEL